MSLLCNNGDLSHMPENWALTGCFSPASIMDQEHTSEQSGEGEGTQYLFSQKTSLRREGDTFCA